MKRSYAHYSDVPAEDWPWASFSPREMASKGEGALKTDSNAMDMLQSLRDDLGQPMLVTSAYRSPAHNRSVGGARASKHLDATAFDIRMDNFDPHVFEAAARKAGFLGFGYYPKSGFMHIDTGPARSWGTHWPQTANDLPVERPVVPETLAEDSEAKAAAGVGLSGAVAVAADHLPAAGSLLGSLAPVAQTIAIAVAALLIVYLIWKRSR
jgi:zinc D-Ala-D-Ala carboxypeptidase